MGSPEQDVLISTVCDLYEKISTLESLKPCEQVNTLFTQLVLACIPPSPLDVSRLPLTVQTVRSKLIRLCGEAEGHLETHYSTLLGTFENPLQHLDIFPYFNNYLKLGLLEFSILSRHHPAPPRRLAFIGSGPLPLTSLVLATNHLPAATFGNYDLDPAANSLAAALVAADADLSKRMSFHTADIMDVTSELGEYDVVFLAALVGMDKEEKVRVIEHLGKYMAPGATLMLRSAHGARAFLYPVVEPGDLGRGFEALSVYHPTDEVINSVVIARKLGMGVGSRALDPTRGVSGNYFVRPCKCSDQVQGLCPVNHLHMVEEFAIDEHLA
ncbi:Nicotianamine synthase [Bertholletia excelsa]